MDDSIQQWTRLESRCRGGTVKPLLLLPGPMVFTNNHTHTETHTHTHTHGYKHTHTHTHT